MELARTIEQDIPVRIRNALGLYLSENGGEWSFVAEADDASVFSYLADNVGPRVKAGCRESGKVLLIEPIDLKHLFEFCDECGDMTPARMAYYNGSRFLCEDCRPAQVP